MNARENVATSASKPLESGHAPVNGIAMYYEIHGRRDGVPLVLLHGGGSTIEVTFGRILPWLAAGRRVIAVEEQGHGRTSDRDGPVTFEASADDVAALLRHLGVAQADLFGFSNGASVALQVAIRHPELVRKLVFASAMTKKEGARPDLWEFIGRAEFSDMPQPLKDAFLRVNPDPGKLRAMHDKDAVRMRSFADVPEELVRSIRAPTLIVLGDRDVVMPEHAVELTRLIPVARLLILPGGHGDYLGEAVVTQEETVWPELTARLVGEFLEAHGDRPESADPVELRVPVNGASLHARAIGRGHPVIVLHGGPDFDHRYLLPDLDRVADSFRLVYYDQRGRGRSAKGVRPEDVTMASDIDDIEKVRRHFRLGAPALLGHSWGAVLALEYALRHPTRVSHLILMNPSPASAADFALFRQTYLEKLGSVMDRQRKIADSDAYQAGDPDAVIARYRIHFKTALTRSGDYERLMPAMEAAFAAQGSEGILKARAIEERLMRDTWQAPGYDLLPQLRALRVPTLVIAGEDDFIPVEIATNIADAIPDAKLVTIPDCGHFAYLECGDQVRHALDQFFLRRE